MPLQSASRVVEYINDTFVDFTSKHFISCIRVRKEREMIHLDGEWMRISLAHDALCNIGDITTTDESNLNAEAHDIAGRNCKNWFWDMLRSIKLTITHNDDALT